MKHIRTPAESQWLRRQAVQMALASVLLLAIFENSQLDLMLSALAYDPALPGFPGQHHPFFAGFMHHGLKSASYAFGALTLALCAYAWRGRVAWLPAANARFLAAAILIIPLTTTLLKKLSGRHCPWDITDFGGFAPYVGLLESVPADITPGACFPAGHASAGFVWLAWSLALRGTRPQHARQALWTALALGSVMGLGRIVQGAHFLSHVLWSAWLAWALCLTLAAVLKVRLDASPAEARCVLAPA